MIFCLIFQCFAVIFDEHFELIDFSCDECFPASRLHRVVSKGMTAFCHNHPEFFKVNKEFLNKEFEIL